MNLDWQTLDRWLMGIAGWSERPTRIQRWAAGTMVVVIGRTDTTGTIHATRVELPRIDVR